MKDSLKRALFTSGDLTSVKIVLAAFPGDGVRCSCEDLSDFRYFSKEISSGRLGFAPDSSVYLLLIREYSGSSNLFGVV